MSKYLLRNALSGLLLLASAASAEEAPATAQGAPPAWLNEIQTYCMVPVLPDRAKELRSTVNGIWAGMGGIDPILTHTETVTAVQGKYTLDAKAFIKDSQDAGLITVGVINGLEGFEPMLAEVPDLADMACRNAKGEPLKPDDMYLMCTNNPSWVEWEMNTGKEIIDNGADLVNLDTPMSSSFIAGFLGGGFCAHCMDLFKGYLAAKYTPEQLEQQFGITAYDAKEIIPRLAKFQRMGQIGQHAFVQDSPDARLYQDFVLCQEQASFDTRKELLDGLRAYAKEKGRSVAFCTNAADMGTQNPGGHWVRGLMFADLVDYFGYEQNNQPDGAFVSSVTPYPRGKWSAYTKLAHAVKPYRSAAVIHAGAMGGLLAQVMTQNKTFNKWMGVQAAETFAANGAYTLYYIEPEGMSAFKESVWADAIGINNFVLDHKDLYGGALKTGSPLALVFLMNERGRTIPAIFPSYLGFGQALIEGNFPYDAVFGGDKKYVKDRMTIDSLKGYQIALVPSPIDPTENQKAVLQQFAREGGTVVCQEPVLLGLSGEGVALEDGGCIASEFAFGDGRVLVISGEVTATGTNDTGSNFFQQYKAEDRAQIIALAEKLGLASVLPEQQDGLVCAYPILQPEQKRAVIHLVNYDVDAKDDAIKQKENLRVRLPRPDFLSGDPTLSLSASGAEAPQAIPVVASGDAIECVVPNLGIYATLTITGQS